ncbi:FAD-binding oxidoreductase [Mesorhizobium sp. ORM6]
MVPAAQEAEGKVSVRDAWPLLGKIANKTPPVRCVRPTSVEQVGEILRQASAAGQVVVAAGARSGVCGALVASRYDVLLDMTGLDRITEIDELNRTVTVEAGVFGGALEQKLGELGYTCGHYPQSLEISTVGGWLATRGIGTFSNKYGGIEQLVVGCEVVLADGSPLRLGGPPRSAAGPRLLELFLGSEGAFGVITEVTLRIFPKAQSLLLGSYAFPTLRSGINAARGLFGEHAVPALLRIYDATESSHLYENAGMRGDEPLMIVGHEGAARVVEAEAAVTKDILLSHGARYLGPEIAEAWNAGRYHAEWLERGNAGADQIADSIEVSVSWANLMPLYERVMSMISPKTSWSMAHLSHFYSTGSMFYFIFGIDDADPESLIARYTSVWEIVQTQALAFGGTCTHHHGVGAVRCDFFRRELGEVGLRTLRGIKHALDPQGILNPSALSLAQG